MRVLKVIILLLMHKDYITLYLNTLLPEGECFTPFLKSTRSVLFWNSDPLYEGGWHAYIAEVLRQGVSSFTKVA